MVEHGKVQLPEEVDALLNETGWTAQTGSLAPKREDYPEIPEVATFYSSAGVPRAETSSSGRWKWHLLMLIGLLLGALIVVMTMIGVFAFVSLQPAVLSGETPTVIEQSVVIVESTPNGAEVEKDGAYLGTTPLEMRLGRGEVWTVELRLSGYETRSVRVAWDTEAIKVPLGKTSDE